MNPNSNAATNALMKRLAQAVTQAARPDQSSCRELDAPALRWRGMAVTVAMGVCLKQHFLALSAEGSSSRNDSGTGVPPVISRPTNTSRDCQTYSRFPNCINKGGWADCP